MKTANRKFSRLLACALVFLLALTAAVPVFAAEPAPEKNRTITIHNNEGLPEMKENQFSVYQLFTGIPERHGDAKEGSAEWKAEEWNNWTLADIAWGSSVKDGTNLLTTLQGLTNAEQKWLGESNPFAAAKDAAGIAAALEGKTNAFMQGFAKFLLDGNYLTALDADQVNGTVDTKSTPNDYSDDTLTYTVPTTGYYLFAEDPTEHTGDAVSEYIIAVMGDQDILLKASVPTVDKDILNGTEERKGDAVGITDTVTYKLTGTLPKNFGDFESYEYIFHDTLSKGLTYNPTNAEMTVTVTIKTKEGATQTYTIATGENGYAVKNSVDGDNTLIDITFADLKTLKGTLTPGGEEPVDVPFASVNAYNEDITITVTYKVTVNENAVIGSEGNPNEVLLEYSNDPNHDSTGKTKEKKVSVYSFALDLTKYASDTGTAGLPGAGFVLSKTDDSGTYYAQFEDVTDAEGNVTTRRLKGWVKQASPAEAPNVDVKALLKAYKDAKQALENAQGTADKAAKQTALETAEEALKDYLLKSGDAGKIPTVSGMDAGTYTLTEAITPDGYNTMDDVEFTIEAKTQTEPQDGSEPVAELVELKASLQEGDADFTTTPSNKTSGTVYGTLTNQKAPFLPFTGGIGTMIFYVLGTALIVGAVTYLVIASRKRNKAEETA